MLNKKLLKNLNDLIVLRKKTKKKIGLCHGVFDILHFGHLKHIEEAKKNVDVLVLSITDDSWVNKGPIQPYNNAFKRAFFLSSINFVDYVFINKDITAIPVIKSLRPNLYFKGQDYLDKDVTNNLKKETALVKKFKGNIKITNTKLMSSTKILNNNLYEWESSQKKYLMNLSSKIKFNKIIEYFDKIEDYEINIIGEVILDKYIFTNFVGVTSKDPAMSLLENSHEVIPGGTMAIAKMLSKFVKKVNLYTYGNPDLLKSNLYNYKNIKIFNLEKNYKIQIKSRYINSNRYEKILQVTNFKKNILNNNNIIKNLNNYKKNIKNNLIICDYGIDLFSTEIVKILERMKIRKFLNVQTNSLNFGFNVYTKYQNFDYLCLDDREWSLGSNQQDFQKEYLLDLSKRNKKIFFAYTRGKKGSSLFFNNKEFFSPTFISRTVDTTGCGDAYYAITSLLILSKVNPHLIPFIGNVYAGMHSQYFGNKEISNKTNLLKYIKSVLNF